VNLLKKLSLSTIVSLSLIVTLSAQELHDGCFIAASANSADFTLQGCSDQQAFLINTEVLSNPLPGTTDEYELVFTLAKDYVSADNNTFYPLDANRDAAFYKNPDQDGDATVEGDRGFFGIFTSIFDKHFSQTIGFGHEFFGNPDVADVKYESRSPEAEDRRQRYLANTVAGLDKNHQILGVPYGDYGTSIDAGIRLNDPVSLLHYAESKKTTSADQCKFIFMNLSSEGLMCRMMGGFGMDAWMPFFNQSNITKMETENITVDTENSLLAMASQITGKSYLVTNTNSDEEKISFLQNILKPMTAMIDVMKRWMFGNGREDITSDPKIIEYTFSEDEAVQLGFSVTNSGSNVNAQADLLMIGLKSVYADELNSCTVKKGFFKNIGTFYDDVEISRTYRPKWWSRKTVTVDWIKGPNGEMTNSDWIDWCQEQTHKKGMFDYLMDRNSFGFMNPMNWMRGFFSIFDYDITNFTSTVKRGLILHLKGSVTQTGPAPV